MRSGYKPISQNQMVSQSTRNLEEIIVAPNEDIAEESNNQEMVTLSGDSASHNPFDRLSNEMFQYILDYLDLLSLSKFARTDTRAKNCVYSMSSVKFFTIPVVKRPIDVNADVEVKQEPYFKFGEVVSFYNKEVNPYAGRVNKIKWNAYEYLGSERLGKNMFGTTTLLVVFGVVFHLISMVNQYHVDYNQHTSAEVEPVEFEAKMAKDFFKAAIVFYALATATAATGMASYLLRSKKPDYIRSVNNRLEYANKLRNATDPDIQSYLPQLTRR